MIVISDKSWISVLYSSLMIALEYKTFFSLAWSSSSDYSITSIIPSDTRESWTNVKVISTSDSENEVVAWYKNGKIYYYSEAKDYAFCDCITSEHYNRNH